MEAFFIIYTMAEELKISIGSKEAQYQSVLPQILALIKGEKNLIANLANITAALKQQFNWLWVGFYLVNEKYLIVGPFQGPIACTRIMKGKGVCGKAWEIAQTLIVDDVKQFPGHIACSSASNSEIVVPVKDKEGNVIAVLDIDSENIKQFDDTDKLYLEKLCHDISAVF